MRKAVLVCFILFMIQIPIYSQGQTRFMLSGGMDVIKTDIQKSFDKYQLGLELDYFLKQKISLNAGYEIWSASQNYYSVGVRYYLFSFVFFRPRILINEDDVNGSIALGYKYFLSRRVGWVSNMEYYFSPSAFAIRTGISYTFTR